jgi:TonB family protein
VKGIVIVALLLYNLPAAAQSSLPKFVLTNSGFEPIVLKFDGLATHEIFDRTLRWFQTIYVDPNKPTISTLESRTIKVNGSIQKAFVMEVDLLPSAFDIEYSLQISSHDNSARLAIEIEQIWWHPFNKKADFTCQRFFNGDGQTRSLFVKTKKELEQSVNLLVHELYQDVKIGSMTRMRQTIDTARVFVEVDKNAEPRHGYPAFYEFLSYHLHYPEHARRSGISGKIVFKFVVEPNGFLTNFEIVKSLSTECDNELIRVLRLCPNWIPGEINRKKVRQAFTMPFNFTLQ